MNLVLLHHSLYSNACVGILFTAILYVFQLCISVCCYQK